MTSGTHKDLQFRESEWTQAVTEPNSPLQLMQRSGQEDAGEAE